MTVNSIVLAVITVAAFASAQAVAGVPKDLAYPAVGAQLTAEGVCEQVYFVNHFYAVDNYSIDKVGRNKITVIINKSKGDKPTTNTVERHLNNKYDDGVVKAKDLAIFRSGKLRGTGMLIVDFEDDDKSQSYAIWLPALRKVRRFAQPAHDDAWGGTDFTFGDVTLRKCFHETHELLGKETFNECLHAMDIPDSEQTRWTKRVKSGPACDHKGKEVYKLKSCTKFKNWWYDCRISYVDTTTFADYRTEYFKDGRKIKVIDRDWGDLEGVDDPRGLYWKYWYGKTFATGHETWAVIPDDVIFVNRDMDPEMWTEKTLRKLKR
jgi:hypothetical protein